MADKKISALTQVSDTDIGADDLLHIVDKLEHQSTKK